MLLIVGLQVLLVLLIKGLPVLPVLLRKLAGGRNVCRGGGTRADEPDAVAAYVEVAVGVRGEGAVIRDTCEIIAGCPTPAVVNAPGPDLLRSATSSEKGPESSGQPSGEEEGPCDPPPKIAAEHQESYPQYPQCDPRDANREPCSTSQFRTSHNS